MSFLVLVSGCRFSRSLNTASKSLGWCFEAAMPRFGSVRFILSLTWSGSARRIMVHIADEGLRPRRQKGSALSGARAGLLCNRAWLRAARPVTAPVTGKAAATAGVVGINPEMLAGLGGDGALGAGNRKGGADCSLSKVLSEFGVPGTGSFAYCALRRHAFLNCSAPIITLVRLHWSPLR